MFLTVTTVVIALIWLLKRNGLAKGVLHPYSWICLFYLFFFFLPPEEPFSDMQMVVDFAVWLSFVLFSIPFLICHKLTLRKAPLFMNTIWSRGIGVIRPLHPLVIVCLTALPIIFCVSFVYIRTIQMGSLENALFGFYAAKRVSLVAYSTFDSMLIAYFARFSQVLLAMSMAVLFVMRIDVVLHRKRIALILFWAVCLLLLFTLATTGARGHSMRLAAIVVIADACAAVRTGRWMFLRPGLVAIVSLAVLLVITLSAIRAHRFDSLSDIASHIQKLSVETVMAEGAVTAGKGGGVPDEVAFCIKYYGSQIPYRYFQTPWAIMVNLVPRELWPEKPVGFGRVLALDQGASVKVPHSIAAGLAGEGYGNGGWIGVVGLSVAIGIICGLASGLAYGMFLQGGMVHLFLAIAIQKVTVFFVRGDMLSAWVSFYPVVILLLTFFLLNLLFNSKSVATASYAYPRNIRGGFGQVRT